MSLVRNEEQKRAWTKSIVVADFQHVRQQIFELPPPFAADVANICKSTFSKNTSVAPRNDDKGWKPEDVKFRNKHDRKSCKLEAALVDEAKSGRDWY